MTEGFLHLDFLEVIPHNICFPFRVRFHPLLELFHNLMRKRYALATDVPFFLVSCYNFYCANHTKYIKRLDASLEK